MAVSGQPSKHDESEEACKTHHDDKSRGTDSPEVRSDCRNEYVLALTEVGWNAIVNTVFANCVEKEYS